MRAMILIALVGVAVGAAASESPADASQVANRRMLLSQKRALAQVTPLNSRLRVDGLGIAGTKLTELLGNINAFARGKRTTELLKTVSVEIQAFLDRDPPCTPSQAL